METHGQTIFAVILALALGLVIHALVGYAPFPYGDDFAYAPLADLRVNPELFPRDDQLRLFANHATVYDWIYTLGRNGPGVETVFHAAVIGLAVIACFALWLILRCLRAPVALLPIVLGLGVVTQMDGLGRGDFGGLVSTFFHHHNVALALILGAVAAAMSDRPAVAGLCLGLAAYAQPMTAVHGALAVGLGTLLANPRQVFAVVGASILIALPAGWMLIGDLPATMATPPDFDLIKDAYRFRASHHYDPSWSEIGLTTLYLLAGCAGAALLDSTNPKAARFALGLVLVFLGLHAVTVLVYKLGMGEAVPLFILDANRSSPLVFVLGPALALAGLWTRGMSLASIATGLLLIAILAVNGTLPGVVLATLGVAMLALERRGIGTQLGAITTVAAAIVLFPPPALPRDISEETLVLLDRVRQETPQDALFVVPIQFAAFRHYAQRSVYVDFKMFSVAQPDQAALTRQRMEEVSRPTDDLKALAGWPAARLWDRAQHARADCATMEAILRQAKADYYVRLVQPLETPPECPDLPRGLSSSRLALYGPFSG